VLATALLGAWASDANAGKTWRVDDDGGPGVDFTDIQPAIDAASAGDFILIAPGTYQGFTLDKGLSLVGPPDRSCVVRTALEVAGLAAAERAVLSGMMVDPGPGYADGGIVVASTAGPVILDNLEVLRTSANSELILARDSADVRVYQSEVRGSSLYTYNRHAMRSRSSRVEIVESYLHADKGQSQYICWPPKEGGTGLWSEEGSTVSIFQSSLVGGDGGDTHEDKCFSACPGLLGADGGDGLLVTGGSVAVVAGDADHHLTPGEGSGEWWQYWCWPGDSGSGLRVEQGSAARYSGVTIHGVSTDSSSVVVAAVPADPYLVRAGRLQAGAWQVFSIHGTPGDTVTLHIGRYAVVVPDPTSEIDQLVTHDRSFALGPIPASGVVELSMALPAGLPAGLTFFAQADVTTSSGLRRTNSIPIVVRSGS
jgi:hypothetical protein